MKEVNMTVEVLSRENEKVTIQLEIDLSAQAPGLYLIKLLYGSTSKTFTTIKE